VAGRASHPAMNAPCGRTSLSSTKLVPDFPTVPKEVHILPLNHLSAPTWERLYHMRILSYIG